MKKATFLLIFSVLAILIISSHASAATRGISVVSKNGQTLNLYDDYHSLVGDNLFIDFSLTLI